MLAFGVFTSGFVIQEPAPYELMMAGLVGIWFLCGLKISRTIAPVLALFTLFNIGGLLSMFTMDTYGGIPLYLAVSYFLALTTVFFAAIIETDHRRLKIIFRAYAVAAVVTAMLGILGYFNLIPGGEYFTLYNRARGAFADPNVFGPFLVLPALYLLHGLIVGKIKDVPLRAIGFFIITFGVFLSFSRAAWGLYAISGVLLIILLLARQRTSKFQLRIIMLSAAGFIALIVALVIALQIDQIAELFSDRAQLVQEYDGARYGRFARHAIGFGMALENPLGIGPLEFGLIYGEDTHNIYLKSLMAYGWLGFTTYLILSGMTFYFGFKYMLRDRPWQVYFMLAMILLFGHALVGMVIDTDHWRHFYLILGIAWGCIALEHRYGINYN
ncbi:O-antigen ligase family protein [Lentilitoribacter sp. Alg239-R112]|uniref:O-antigen ligase family protein n=1 Tax=Lentilitoribacter sp. Alg239-R112 TaxID=2305987 RepID=UPI0013A6B814|nr:O-antigen ligase family protein [Lentilitoribacter sp. Alg239-R112]